MLTVDGRNPTPWVVPPPRIPVANEGLGWDPLLKIYSNNPGGDWHPGRGGQPNLHHLTSSLSHSLQGFSTITGGWEWDF